MSETKNFLEVRIAGQNVAIDVDAIWAVAAPGDLIPVPLATRAVTGLTTIRGRPVTVVDPMRLLGQETAIGADAHFVVVQVDDFTYAVLVEAVEEVCAVDAADIAALPPGLSADWAALTSGMIAPDGRPLLVLRLEGLVSPESSAAA